MSANSWPHFPGVDIPSLTNTLSNLVIRFERINHQDLCLAYVRGLPWIASLVLGMETEMQLSENMGLFGEKPLTPEQISEVHRAIPYLPESFLDPAQWK